MPDPVKVAVVYCSSTGTVDARARRAAEEEALAHLAERVVTVTGQLLRGRQAG